FFQVLGIVLMVFAAGLLSDAVENLQQLKWLPFGTHVVWNSSGIITESSSFGDVLHSLVGYADRPTVLQVVVWIAYVVASVTIFIRLSRDRRPASPKPVGPTTAPASKKARHLPT
ncbi:MAG: FTR1 family protein, partial [Acidimicrobiales bacterium]